MLRELQKGSRLAGTLTLSKGQMCEVLQSLYDTQVHDILFFLTATDSREIFFFKRKFSYVFVMFGRKGKFGKIIDIAQHYYKYSFSNPIKDNSDELSFQISRLLLTEIFANDDLCHKPENSWSISVTNEIKFLEAILFDNLKVLVNALSQLEDG